MFGPLSSGLVTVLEKQLLRQYSNSLNNHDGHGVAKHLNLKKGCLKKLPTAIFLLFDTQPDSTHSPGDAAAEKEEVSLEASPTCGVEGMYSIPDMNMRHFRLGTNK
jgi:hypothetical protein